MADITILLSSAGRRVALLQALRDGAARCGLTARIVVADLSPLSSAGHMADSYQLVPALSDPGYLDALRRLVDREQVDVVVPTIDTELTLLAQNREALEQTGATVLVSSPETIALTADKRRSSAWFLANGLGAPRQYTSKELPDLPTEDWPLFFKPLNGSSSIGAQPVSSIDQVLLATERHGPGVVETLVVGREYTLDCWVDPSRRCAAVVPRHRLATRAGEIAKGVTVRDRAVEAEVTKLVEALPGARGPITVQAIVDDTGPKYLEVNPRFGGGYPLSHAAGARFTAALAAEVTGNPVDPTWFEWEPDVAMLRYDDAVFLPWSEVESLDRV